MVGEHQWKLGVFGFEYGLTDALSVGVDPPAWALWAMKDVFVPNLHVKGRLARAPLVSGQIGVYWARIGRERASGDLWMVPMSVFLSRQLRHGLWAHVEANYNWVRAFGAGDPSRVEIAGGLATRSGQLGAMLEQRLGPVAAIVARGRWQVLTRPLVLAGSTPLDPYTQAEVALEGRPVHRHPWMAVAGVALTWRHVGMTVAAGYGHYFVPGANIAVAARGFVPDASFWVRF
jgi:hypothetical protein